jgi:hypothetical protein
LNGGSSGAAHSREHEREHREQQLREEEEEERRREAERELQLRGEEGWVWMAPRVYCFVSRHCLTPLHVQALESVVQLDRLARDGINYSLQHRGERSLLHAESQALALASLAATKARLAAAEAALTAEVAVAEAELAFRARLEGEGKILGMEGGAVGGAKVDGMKMEYSWPGMQRAPLSPDSEEHAAGSTAGDYIGDYTQDEEGTDTLVKSAAAAASSSASSAASSPSKTSPSKKEYLVKRVVLDKQGGGLGMALDFHGGDESRITQEMLTSFYLKVWYC